MEVEPPQVQPPLALDTTEEDKDQMKLDKCKHVPVPDMAIDHDLRDKPFKDWPQDAKRRKLLDDVPLSIKAKFIGTPSAETAAVYFNEQIGKKQLPLLGMCCAVDVEYDEIKDTYLVRNDDAWIGSVQKDAMSKLLGVRVVAARAHVQPRRRLMNTKIPKKNIRRLTIMLNSDGKTKLHDDTGIGSRKMAEEWKGVTVYYNAQDTLDTKQVCFLDTPCGMIPFWMTPEEQDDVKHIYECWKQVYTLQLKAGAKELDPRLFNAIERAAFNESDAEEWHQWIKNRVVKPLTAYEERQVPKDKIFSSPLRFVRTNKGEKTKALKAKSRLVVPGHRDPDLGEFRTDSPTTSTLAVQVTAAVAVSMDWEGETFDVSTAFLSGKETSRNVYLRAPKEGLPAVEGHKAIKPLGVLELLKGA